MIFSSTGDMLTEQTCTQVSCDILTEHIGKWIKAAPNKNKIYIGIKQNHD